MEMPMYKIKILLFVCFLISGCAEDQKPTATISSSGVPQEFNEISFVAEDILDPQNDEVSVSWSLESDYKGVELSVDELNSATLFVGDVREDLVVTVLLTVSDTGGNSNTYNHSVSIINEKSSHKSQYPILINADVTIKDLYSQEDIFSTYTNESGDFIVNNNEFNDDSLYEISITDGVTEQGESNYGEIKSLSLGSDIKQKTIITSVFSDAIFRSLSQLISDVTKEELISLMGYKSTSLYKKELTSDLEDGEYLNIVAMSKYELINTDNIHTKLANEILGIEPNVQILQTYYSGNTDDISAVIKDLFKSYISFGNRDNNVVKSKLLSLTLFGAGKVTDQKNIVNFDTNNESGFKTFIVPADVDEITLSLETYGGYELSSWSGCVSFSNDSCIVDTSKDNEVSLILTQEAVYASNYYNLNNYLYSKIDEDVIFNIDLSDQPSFDIFKNLKEGDFISSNQGDGFISKIDNIVEGDDGEFVITVSSASIDDIIVSGTFVFDHDVTNEDVAREAMAKQNKPFVYNAGSLVSVKSDNSVYVKLADDKKSKNIQLITRDEDYDIDINPNYAWRTDGQIYQTPDSESYFVSLSVPTTIRVNNRTYFDKNIIGSGSLILLGITNTLNMTSTPTLNIVGSTGKKFADSKILEELSLAKIPTALGVFGINISLESHYSFNASASVGASTSIQAAVTAGMYFDSSRPSGSRTTIVKPNPSIEWNGSKVSSHAESEIYIGLRGSLFPDYNTLEIPASAFVGLGGKFKGSVLGFSTDTPSKCYGNIVVDIFTQAQAGVKFGFRESKLKIMGVTIETPVYEAAPLFKQAHVYSDGDIGDFGEKNPECYNPKIDIKGSNINKSVSDGSTIEQLYTVENVSEVTAYYTAELKRPDGITSISYKSSEGGSWQNMGASGDEKTLLPGKKHIVRVNIDASIIDNENPSETYINSFKLKHARLPLFGAESLKNEKTYSIKVLSSNINNLSAPKNLSANIAINNYRAVLRWDYDESPLDRRFQRKFKIIRISESSEVVIGYIKTNQRYFYDTVPKRGSYTYRISIISGDYETASISASASSVSSLVGNYSGTYSWDCGPGAIVGHDENGDPIQPNNSGSYDAYITVHSDSYGRVTMSINFGNDQGTHTNGRVNNYQGNYYGSHTGSRIYISEHSMYLGKHGVISGTSYNGPNCSHVTNPVASRFTVYKQ
jgi:hypothetical protein